MQNHYVIAKLQDREGHRLVFGKVNSSSRGILSGFQEKDAHIDKLKQPFEVPLKDVVLDLGEKPHPGSVYGFDTTNRFTKRKSHEFFGSISFFYDVKKEVAKKLFDAFDRAQKILEKAGFYFPAGIAVWQILPPEAKGKWAGYYKHSKKPNDNPHRFAIKPESLPESEWVYVILHEFAHYLHATAMTLPKLNATWVRLFNTSIKLQTVKKEASVQMLDALVSGEERPSDFKSGLDEDQRNAYSWIIRTIKQDHALTIRELDILFEADERETIRELWPQRTIHQKDLKPVVSEYSCVSYHELIAESLSFYWTKRKLPEAVVKLVEKSLSVAKAAQESGE
jgi:hypothetical protein